MKAVVVGQAHADDSALGRYQTLPSFRKATRNMKLAHAALEQAVQKAGYTFAELKNAAFVVGSSYGELESTKEFLKTWAVQKMARPLLFQNSLHNGTLGFLSIELGITGPSFTVSQHTQTREEAIALGQSLIETGMAEHCLVVVVEALSPDLRPAIDADLKDGAEAFLVAAETAQRSSR